MSIPIPITVLLNPGGIKGSQFVAKGVVALIKSISQVSQQSVEAPL